MLCQFNFVMNLIHSETVLTSLCVTIDTFLTFDMAYCNTGDNKKHMGTQQNNGVNETFGQMEEGYSLSMKATVGKRLQSQ